MACNSKGWTESEVWDFWVVVTCISSPFYLLVFKVMLGAFGALVSKWHITQKLLTVEWNGMKFGTQGRCSMYIGYFHLLMFRSFWDHLVHYSVTLVEHKWGDWPCSIECEFGGYLVHLFVIHDNVLTAFVCVIKQSIKAHESLVWVKIAQKYIPGVL